VFRRVRTTNVAFSRISVSSVTRTTDTVVSVETNLQTRDRALATTSRVIEHHVPPRARVAATRTIYAARVARRVKNSRKKIPAAATVSSLRAGNSISNWKSKTAGAGVRAQKGYDDARVMIIPALSSRAGDFNFTRSLRVLGWLYGSQPRVCVSGS